MCFVVYWFFFGPIFVSQPDQLGAIPPPPFLSVSPLESIRSGGAIPPHKRVSQRYLRETAWKQGKLGAITPLCSDGVRVRFRVRFQAVKVPIFGGYPVENPTKKANRLKALLRGISLSEYGLERFRVRLRRLSEYGSVAYLVERPTRETRAEQYSDTVLSAILSRSGQPKTPQTVTLQVRIERRPKAIKNQRTVPDHVLAYPLRRNFPARNNSIFTCSVTICSVLFLPDSILREMGAYLALGR